VPVDARSKQHALAGKCPNTG